MDLLLISTVPVMASPIPRCRKGASRHFSPDRRLAKAGLSPVTPLAGRQLPPTHGPALLARASVAVLSRLVTSCKRNADSLAGSEATNGATSSNVANVVAVHFRH